MKAFNTFLDKAFLKNKGFSLIGVLIAMSVGSIVIAGVSKLLAMTSMQLRDMESQIQRNNLNRLISDTIKTKACKHTLDKTQKTQEITKGLPVKFTKFYKDDNNSIDRLDLTKTDFGEIYELYGDMFYQIKCIDEECDCQAGRDSAQAPCTTDGKNWQFNFVFQKRVGRTLVYDQYSFNNLLITAGAGGNEIDCGDDIGGGSSGGSDLAGQTDDSNTGITSFGHDAGTGGQKNTFMGYKAGDNGGENAIMGTEAGKDTTGWRNTLIGYRAGYNTSNNDDNTFIGRATGYNTDGEKNTFIGSGAGDERDGDNNIFIGYKAGKASSHTGDNNIFIGNEIKKNVSNYFALGYEGNIWMEGDMITDSFSIGGTDKLYYDGTDLKVGSQKVCLENGTNCQSSSRTLKKNIKPFKDFDGSLKDILKTPLFTYEFKKDQTKKKRRGIISEDLPPHLQIKEKGKVSRPDWPSIYGTLWAGIRALHDKLVKEDSKLKEQIKKLQKELEKNNKRLKELEKNNKRLKELEKELKK